MKVPSFREIEKREFKGDWHTEQWEVLLKYLSGLGSKKELDEFLKVFIPEKSRERILKHVIVADRLAKGAQYREIENELGVTQQTISAVSKAIQEGDYKTYNIRFVKTRERAIQRKQRYLDKKAEKPVPKLYRRTKYGKMSY